MSRIKLCAVVFLALLTWACAAKQHPVYLPAFEPLPEVTWTQGKDGRFCTEDGQALYQREQLRNLREETLISLLEALGASQAPSTTNAQINSALPP